MANEPHLHTPSTTQSRASSVVNLGTYGNGNVNDHGNGIGNRSGGFSGYQSHTRELTVKDIADIDDPIELLEKLTNTKWDSRNLDTPTTRTNAQFASLLNAAETAGGVDARRSGTPSSNNGNRQSTRGSPARTSSKRGRDESEDRAEEGEEMFGFINAKAKPRKVRKLTAEEEEEAAREREIWGSEPSDVEEDDEEAEDEGENSQAKSSTIPDLNPRAHGVHSAAALFRKTSASGRKYTRPAMAKVFTKLELAPEDFITLQAAAKDYMLDPKHPDRSACIGTKEKRDNDLTKLKLYACVRNFLADEGEGWGERLFGRNSPSGATRRWIWPDMPNKIISRITPLLRRMVTNERQRLYALNLRNQKRKEEELFQLRATSFRNSQASQSPLIDPQLTLPDQNIVNKPIAGNSAANIVAETQTAKAPEVSAKQPAPLEYHINIIHNGKRIRDVFTLNPTNCVGFVSFTAHVDAAIKAPYKKTAMKVLGPNGLVEIKSEATYAMALLSVRKTEWMDGDVKIIVETTKTE
ncbi:5027147d-d184-4329-a758-ac0262d8a730 [Sclerotinia trifoliorum]|uniref:5027147d-d184-4329-a758-ac0262d8a730 n=1 Tax=Sclerotinia trifoliorum TaxID=28548 RepID=A0A8H2ZLY2_9HELO|nr:5027147d-d184-4329-a758-ac0262d8a730 [Sclerotinia trifoliorum]